MSGSDFLRNEWGALTERAGNICVRPITVTLIRTNTFSVSANVLFKQVSKYSLLVDFCFDGLWRTRRDR
jgi:hypothetical protein